MTTIDVLQVPDELAMMVALYAETRPRRVLEIGSWQGGTMHVWLTQATPDLVVAVDLDHQREDLYEKWADPATEVVAITASSLEPETKTLVREHGPYDWLFVDGDHSEHGVRSDVELAIEVAAPGATVLIHDIVDCYINDEGFTDGPSRVFAELAAVHDSEQFIAPSGRWGHGIGVIHL